MWKPQSHQQTLENAIEKVQHMEERRSIRYKHERSPPRGRQKTPPMEFEVKLDPKTGKKNPQFLFSKHLTKERRKYKKSYSFFREIYTYNTLKMSPKELFFSLQYIDLV